MIILLILTSCATASDAAESGADDGAVVTTLIRDMVSAVEDRPLSSSDIEEALDSSYLSYSGYIPSYVEIRNRYLASLLAVVEEGRAELFSSTVLSAGEEIGNNPSPYLSGELVTPSLMAATAGILTERLTEYLLGRSGELDSAFSESEDTFGRVRKAYAALSAVSKGVVLPTAGKAAPARLAAAAVESYFSLLGDEEREIRSNPLYGGRSLFLENQI